MPRCLVLSPYPTVLPRHGGQIRVDSIIQGLCRTGWDVVSAGIYPFDYQGNVVSAEERGVDDIVLDHTISAAARDDILFFDFLAARQAAQDPRVISQVRRLVDRVDPDIIHIEQPWGWLLLRETAPWRRRPKIVYSCQNIEWRFRRQLFRLGLQRSGAEELTEAVRLLEAEVACAADLVVAISDIEAAEIEQIIGHPVVYAPPVSALADLPSLPVANRYTAEAAEAGVSAYAALVGSGHFPNVEGFFDVFPEGLGFLPLDQQVWVCGSLGESLTMDARYQHFLSINHSRTRILGHLAEEDKAAFFGAAACVVVPVREGGGAKLKTADAIASGRPVVITPHALEGYGPLVQDAIGRGIYVADAPSDFRACLRRAMCGDLEGCPDDVRTRVSPEKLAHTLNSAYRALLTGSEYLTQLAEI